MVFIGLLTAIYSIDMTVRDGSAQYSTAVDHDLVLEVFFLSRQICRAGTVGSTGGAGGRCRNGWSRGSGGIESRTSKISIKCLYVLLHIPPYFTCSGALPPSTGDAYSLPVCPICWYRRACSHGRVHACACSVIDGR